MSCACVFQIASRSPDVGSIAAILYDPLTSDHAPEVYAKEFPTGFVRSPAKIGEEQESIMRNLSVVPAFLAAVLVASVALAANDKVVASFNSLSSSGVNGEVTLNQQHPGGTLVHGKLAGLQPGTEYVAQWYTEAACGAGTATELTRFRSNPAGVASFNAKTDRPIVDIKSIAVQLASDQSLQACANITQ